VTSHEEFQQVLTKLVFYLDKLKQILVAQTNSNVKHKTKKHWRSYQQMLFQGWSLKYKEPNGEANKCDMGNL
jgi:hypothetical protein